MSPEVMAEYLVKLSADIDTNSFNSAMMAINQLSAKLKSMKGVAAMAALGAGLAKVGTAAVGLVKDVAKADLEFAKLGQRMWVTKDTAKALSVAMKTMGCSQEDIAWVPELREQFFRLRNEMNELATPEDAEDGLKFVRSIGYEIESVQVKLKMLKEWVTYYLIKIIRPFMEEFREWVKWLNGKLKGRPDIAKTIAKWLGFIVSLATSAIKAIRKIGESVYNFFERMPASVKKWGAILAGVGAFVMASPLGRLLTVLGGALLLLEDFIYYCNGWNSSKALAPVWQKILNFLESDTLKKVEEIATRFLKTAAKLLETISKHVSQIIEDLFGGIDWEGLFDELEEGVNKLLDGIIDVHTEIDRTFDSLENRTNEKAAAKQRKFWSEIGRGISDALKSLFTFVGVLGDALSAVAAVVRLDFDSALEHAKSAMGGMAKIGQTMAKNGVFNPFGISLFGGDVAKTATENYKEGDQWMGSVTKDPNIQCDSYTADVYADTGIMPHKKGQITTADDWKAGNAYHEAGDGYELQPGDYIDGKTHVGIYLGNGMYRARNSSGGIHTGTMEEWNELFGEPIGYGSVNEYVKNTNPKEYEKRVKEYQAQLRKQEEREAQAVKEGVQKYRPNFDDGRTQYGIWKKQNPSDWMMTGAQNAAGARSFRNSFAATAAPSQVSYGDINVNVNVAGTNATANDIANATAKKIINARMNKGVTV